MIATFEQPSPLDEWRQRLGGRRRRTQPRPLAAMGFLADGPVVDDLIEVENLTIVLLYDEPIRPGQCALRLAGYSGSRIPWGVRFGGPDRCRFVKDLALQPVLGGQGYRLDLANDELLMQALALNRQLNRHARFCEQVRERPFLPKLWAGFHRKDAAGITGPESAAHSPELAAYASRVGRTPASLLERLCCDHQGLTLFPLAWVSHRWHQAASVFADLRHFPERQVFHLRQRDDLAGFHDAAEFDLHNRFRSSLRQRRAPNAAVSMSA